MHGVPYEISKLGVLGTKDKMIRKSNQLVNKIGVSNRNIPMRWSVLFCGSHCFVCVMC